MITGINYCTLNYSDKKTYMWASAFVLGNILQPQLCHLVPQGGMILLPIYFFTLMGAYKMGWKVGLLTAVMSPVVNTLLFSMPRPEVLPAVLVKSVLLALCAAYAARKTGKATLLTLAGVVVAYQTLGIMAEWLMTESLFTALQDVRLGLPGMLIQVFGTWLLLNKVWK